MRSTRRTFMESSIGAFVAAEKAHGSPKRRPNVLFIIVDEWSAVINNLGGSNSLLRTPATRSLAASGVRFDNAYCTFPFCSPSRASLFTGRMPHQCGVMFNYQGVDRGGRIPVALPRLGDLFSEAGYDTGYFGKEHLGGAMYRGFQDRGSIQWPGAGTIADGAVLDPVFTRDAIGFIRKERDKPFLAVLSLINPHDVWWVPSGPVAPEKKPLIGITTAFDPCYWMSNCRPAPAIKYLRNQELPELPPNAQAPSIYPGQRTWPEDAWRNYLANYYLLMENTDWNISLALGALRESGLDQNTIVLFTSDHGEMAGAHHLIGKWNFYEEAVRVPLALTWPGVIRPGQVSSQLVTGADVLPTLCDYAGIEPPKGIVGRSLRALAEERSGSWRSCVVSETVTERMVRSKRYKYVLSHRDHDYTHLTEHLFDLRTDPGEWRDLAGQPNVATILKEHRVMLEDWAKQTGGSFEAVDRDIQEWFA